MWFPELVVIIEDSLCPSAPPLPTQTLQMPHHQASATSCPQSQGAVWGRLRAWRAAPLQGKPVAKIQ